MTSPLPRALGFLALCCSLAACRAERHLMFESDPPGAQLRVDGVLVGRTPFDMRFESYGSRHVTMQRQGYRRYSGEIELETPWYSIFPLDYVSEIFLPFGWKDIHRLEVTLAPLTGEVSEPDFDGVLIRAERLRRGGPAGPNQLVPQEASELEDDS